MLGKSFDQVIQRDKNFGRLLTKIKKAYDEYVAKLAEQQTQRAPQVDAPQNSQVADSSTNTPTPSPQVEDQKLKEQLIKRDNQISDLEKENEQLQKKMKEQTIKLAEDASDLHEKIEELKRMVIEK